MSIRDILEEESRRLDQVISKAMADIGRAPEGNLFICRCRGCLQFYHHRQGSSKTTYLSKRRDMALVRALAQKKYAANVMREACRQKAVIDRFIAEYDPQAISRIAENIGGEDLISPYVEQDVDSPFSINAVTAEDLSLVSQMMELCSRILNRSTS